ncbi:ABC transporter permease subunit [Paenibacillus sp. WQ 127069]|uniref:ABC transporter permease subunit n=1 Tax=Paenibacillus baimaensis TaxID=2982185 RepID=A0ABT2U8E7_9BACL|nr:ABC transporter permease subunit [Paenibacillus sp. WQ 127069]MCU6790891.1 ABC transporter permease subunit [Paenibacillus sp. WQ 127069]
MEAEAIKVERARTGAQTNQGRRWKKYMKFRYIYLLTLPGFFYFLLFKVVPMGGLIIAFQNYSPSLGILQSQWVGLENFIDLFTYDHFYKMLRNTLVINLFNLCFFFPLPIVISLMLNELRHEWFKRLNQSILYMPHFMSWVVVASLTFFLLSQDIGIINKYIAQMGGETRSFLTNPDYFWGLLTAQNIWKDVGWGTIIFLAATAGVDPQLYEAVEMDGAGRWRKIWHVTLPAIRSTIVILLVLRLGHMADVGFEQLLLMINPLVNEVADVFDTYAFTQGVQRGQISVGVTVGLFKGLIGLILVVMANKIVKRMGHEGIY